MTRKPDLWRVITPVKQIPYFYSDHETAWKIGNHNHVIPEPFSLISPADLERYEKLEEWAEGVFCEFEGHVKAGWTMDESIVSAFVKSFISIMEGKNEEK